MTFIDSGFALARPAATGGDFGINPGHLLMHHYCPPDLQPGAPLVVLLHGCRQDAPAYAAGTGWPALAARHGFALLLPGQARGNNPLGCFRWFEPEQVAREGGELASILAMIEVMLARHRLDRRRVFVTGLSAGGAMTSALLARAPEVFAGAGIIAGLPFGAADSAQAAFQAMREPAAISGEARGDQVRAAAPFTGRRPSVSIWQGSADRTVNPANAEALEAQWADVLGLDPARMVTERFGSDSCRSWRDWLGQTRLRRWTIEGLGHGAPISPNAEEEARRLGQPGRFMLDSTIGSTWTLAHEWGLLGDAESDFGGRLRATFRAAHLLP